MRLLMPMDVGIRSLSVKIMPGDIQWGGVKADRSCYRTAMLKTRMKRIAARTEHELQRLAAIEAAVAALGDEDLLDFADIFAAGDQTPLRVMAEDQMRRRGLSL